MVIIGIHGKAGVGKDTAALFIMKQDRLFLRYAFADPMRAIVAHLFNVPYDDLQTAEGKAKYNPYWQRTHRTMLQEFGQTIRDNLGQDHWIKLLIDRVSKECWKADNIVITDVRHQNELDFILDAGGYILHIESSVRGAINPASKEAAHASEQPLDIARAKEYNRYCHIQNDGSKDEFQKQVHVFLSYVNHQETPNQVSQT